jgi:acyloxyacyl hydrolase
MNTNATLRDLTTQHAQLLSSILKNISTTAVYKNFDVFYLDNPFNAGKRARFDMHVVDENHPLTTARAAIAEWEAGGGAAWQLIEPVDGA